MVPVRVAYNNNNIIITWYNKAYIHNTRGNCIKASVFERRISPGLAEIIVTSSFPLRFMRSC